MTYISIVIDDNFEMNTKKISTSFSRMWLLNMHRRKRFYCCTALIALIFILVGEYLMHPVNYNKIITYTKIQAWPNDIPKTADQTGCVMPKLEPFLEEAMKSNNVLPITCVDIDWVSCYKTKCSVKQQVINEMKSIECIYTDIIYVRDDSYYFGEPSKVLWTDEYVLNKSDLVKVSCTGREVNGFGEVHWSGNKAGFRDIETSNLIETIQNSSNVLILLFHSSSRNGFIRRMPKSYKTLTDQLQAVVFESHNIVGDGTAGALFPIMTGHNELELEDLWNISRNNKYMNENFFLFHVLKKNGYQTALLKDYPEIDTFRQLFNLFERGQPADHYLRPFFMEEADHGWWYKRQKYCVGNQPVYRFLLNLTKQFFELPGKKFCITMICETSHDDFNMITAADDDLVSFLKTFRSDKRLRDTLLIVMGDYGARFGSMKDTYEGKVEEGLPFLSIVLPDKLRTQKHNALTNLRNNKNVLTTHYDIHTTVLDAVGLKDHRNSYKVLGSDTERGLSFLEPIPQMRTCADAGVMPQWCVCLEWHNLDPTHVMYSKSAAALVGYIDSIIEEKRSKCSKRNLLAIEWVMTLSPNEQMLSYKKEIERFTQGYKTAEKTRVRAESEYYRAKIVLGPGRPGIFECSMKFIVKEKIFVIFEKDITRVNAYGDEPKCVSSTHPHLNKYCYCKDYSLSLGYFGLVGF